MCWRTSVATFQAALFCSCIAFLAAPSSASAQADCEAAYSGRDYGGEDVFLLEDQCWTGEHLNIGRLTVGPGLTLQSQPGSVLTIQGIEIHILGHLSADEAGGAGGSGGERGLGGSAGVGNGAGSDGDDVEDCAQSEVERRNAGGGGGGASSHGGDGFQGGDGADAADDGCQGADGGAGGATWGTTSISVEIGAGAGGGGGAGGTHYIAGEAGSWGGGGLHITGRVVTVHGANSRISADGGRGGRGGTSGDVFHGGGGGGGAAGGGIYIRTTYLVGDGVISARGGAGGEGGIGDIRDGESFNGGGGSGGGGGRILIERSRQDDWTGDCDVAGGTPGAGTNSNQVDTSPAGSAGECQFEHANGEPEADAGGPYADAEGNNIELDASDSSDPDDDELTYEWDLGCDDSVDLTGVTVETFYRDDQIEPYPVCLTVTDPGNLTHSATTFVTVFDAPPAAHIQVPEELPIEGATFAVNADASSATGEGRIDDSIQDSNMSWDFDFDVDTGFVDRGITGSSQTHSFPDNGRYFIGVQVTDEDGGSAVAVAAVDVVNAPPVITNADEFVVATDDCDSFCEGVAWTYQMEVDDPGTLDTHDYEILAGPLGMVVTEGGEFRWTPMYAHALEDDITIRLTVTDNDFGRAILTQTVSVAPADTDEDGIPDGWELAQVPPMTVGVDDSLEDPDRDGVSNFEEFERGSDPYAFDGPGAPRLAFPPFGYELRHPVDTNVSVYTATDPDNSPLTYKIAIFDGDPESEVALEPVVEVEGIEPEGITASMAIVPEDGLLDNTRYWWRAWANDGLVFGPSSEVGHFFVNAVQDCPTVPRLLTPADHGRVTSRQPVFVVENSVDIDEDPVMYWFLIYEDEELRNAILNSGLIEEGGGTTTTWQPETELLDHHEYYWRVKAVDAEGCESGFSDTWSFLTSIGNLTPGAPVILEPENGSTTSEGRPTIIVQNAEDPDRDFLTYVFEIDTEPTFDSEAHQESGAIAEGLPSEGTSWQVESTLADNAFYYVRVQAHDDTAFGPFAESTFRVNFLNDPPTAPVPINPPEGSTIENQRPRLSVENALDPDGETLVYHFQVYADSQLEELLIEREDIPESIEVSFWRINEALLSGPYWWRARALDHSGGGPWSDVSRFTITLARRNDVPDAGADVVEAAPPTTSAPEDCGCKTIGPNVDPSILIALGFVVLGIRRRRR